jgi:hypothetical protein
MELLKGNTMILKLNKFAKLKEIQEDFAKAFPYLKLEFFRHPHNIYEASPKNDMRQAGELAMAATKKFVEAEVRVEASMTVAELEQAFLKAAGLHAQVFRKSGTVWIENSLTDVWTLEHQNNEGELLSAHQTFDPAYPNE